MKPTTAQLALLHVAESAASSALLTLIVGIFQQLATGQIHTTELLTVFGSGFVASFGLIYKTVKADPNFKQAETDTAGQIQQYVEERFTAFETRLVQWFARQTVAAQPTSPQIPTAIRTSTPAPSKIPQQPFPPASPSASLLGRQSPPLNTQTWQPSSPLRGTGG